MNIEIAIIEGPLGPPAPWRPGRAGAVVCFEGVVRLMEGERPLQALMYEVYEPMTSRELGRLAQATLTEHGLIAVRVEHSRGVVPVGDCSFRLRIASAHRKAALQAMDAFIDRMKQHVPIWKRPMWQAAPTAAAQAMETESR